jgi:hypothetical protein
MEKLIRSRILQHNTEPARQNNMFVPATTPFILRSVDNFSTNWCGVRYLTFENST